MTARRTSVVDAPLLACGEALRRQRRRRQRVLARLALTAGGCVIVATSAAVPPAPRLVWNASASAPRGLYAVTPGALAAPGDMVVARVPTRFRRLAAVRRYLPLNVPLVKRVAAYAGDDVCAVGTDIRINGRLVATRRNADGRGRAMPAWQGCVRLRGRQLLLLNAAPASFDGRYFGVTEATDVLGTARLLWSR